MQSALTSSNHLQQTQAWGCFYLQGLSTMELAPLAPRQKGVLKSCPIPPVQIILGKCFAQQKKLDSILRTAILGCLANLGCTLGLR